MTRRMEQRDATEVYVSESGNICIKQEDGLGADDAVISLEPSQVPTIMKWIQECMEEAGYPTAEIKPIK